MILAATSVAAAAQTTPPAAGKLSIENIFGKQSLLADVPTEIQWRGDSKAVSYLTKLPGEAGARDRNALVMREVPSGREHILCIADTVHAPADLRDGDDPFSISSHRWNHAGTRVVFTHQDELFMLDPNDGRIQRLTNATGKESDATFSPDDRMLAYVRGNDLFTMDLEKRTEVRHTTTGCDTIYNGILNWIYMEELFTRGDVKAFWWSPDGSRIAFLEIRDGNAPVYPIVDQIPTQATWTMQHYPKPGDPAPVVRVGIVNPAGGGNIVWSDVDSADDSYLARVYWLGDGSGVAVEKLNRAQDHLALVFVDPVTGHSDLIMEESSDSWVNVNYLKHYFRNKREFLWGSERDGHSHLYLHNLDGSLIRQLTNGNFEVSELAGVDERKGRVYFIANERSVLETHLYRVNENGKDFKQITKEEGTHGATLSPDFKYFIDTHNSHKRPTHYTVCSIDGKALFEIGDQMSDEFAASGVVVPEFFTIEEDGNTFQCRMFRPPHMDLSKRYPVIVYVYGGPHAQVVRKAWSRHDLWFSYMAENGYIVFSLDNRGSAGRGKAWEEPVLRNMGDVELQDQLAGVEYLKSLSYVDADRIGIFGWSYGGYMTLTALFNAPDAFAAGVSVAPVADWRLYDSIYTERYMKQPDENKGGYDASSPLLHAKNLEDPLLLMHGDADDNVHMQNSMALIRELVAAGKDFDMMLYPQKEHGISGSDARSHLYRKMTIFFERHLKEKAPAPGPTP
jgi:dipeptidyl-peptidase-4